MNMDFTDLGPAMASSEKEDTIKKLGERIGRLEDVVAILLKDHPNFKNTVAYMQTHPSEFQQP